MKKNTENNNLNFLQHLEILRWHIIRAAAAVLIFATLAFIFSNYLFDLLLLYPRDPNFFTNLWLCELANYFDTPDLCINQKPFEIISGEMAGQFSTTIMVSLYAGLIIACPYVIWEFWRFLKPALYPKEQKMARGATFFISLCFIIGVLFGYYIIVPLSIHFLTGWTASEQIVNRIDLNSYFSTVAYIPLSTGLVFELPIIIAFLIKVGLITPKFLKTYRRHAYVLLMILAAIITPPDIISMLLVVLPLIILYEISIWIGVKTYKQQNSTNSIVS